MAITLHPKRNCVFSREGAEGADETSATPKTKNQKVTTLTMFQPLLLPPYQ